MKTSKIKQIYKSSAPDEQKMYDSWIVNRCLRDWDKLKPEDKSAVRILANKIGRTIPQQY